ncbi:MAG TPA: TonB-dependent receptor [Gammaproteobacteria bacterium]|nr:TonB-dependent receptor [Gammaproteobacteria bacterium]
MNKKPPTRLVASKATGRAAVHLGSALACVAYSGVLLAQQQNQGPEEIVVTGTRIPDPNLVSTSPIQVVSSTDIRTSGRNDVSDILQLLPQNFNNDLGQDLGNRTSGLTTAGGVATADLRGLGPNRTLVLVNGRRLGIGSPYTAIAQPAPDLDQIPSELIERVDVVTGGASAVYGSDAIAGVINFVTKRDYEGIQFDVQTGFNWHDNDNEFAQQLARDAGFDAPSGTTTDGRTTRYSMIAGANSGDGRGNFTVYLGYQTQDGVRSDQRDYGAGQLFTDTDEDGVPLGTASMGGSGNSNLFQPKTGPLGSDPTAVFSVFGNQFVPIGTEDTTPPAVFNSQKDIFITRDYRRSTAGLIGHYDLNEHVEPYVEFSFMNDKTHQEIAPSGLFAGGNVLTADNNYLINCSNPLLSDQQRNILCSPAEIAADTATPGSALASVFIGRRNIEGGGRIQDYEHTNYRGVAGVRGDIGRAWTFDGYGQYYYVQFYTANDRYLNLQKITNALQVTTDPETGEPVCIVGPPCVPYNIFADGGVTQDALDYLYTTGTANGTTSLRTVHVDFTGNLEEYGVKLPSANEGLGINVGYETREEKVNFKPDDAELSGLLSGFGGASVAIDEAVDVDEYFAELRLPLVQDKRGVTDLSIDAGFRRSDYSTTGAVNTSKFEIQYAPVDSARIRASYNKAIRAPSIIELFTPQLVGKIQIGTDPCAPTNNGTTPAVNTLEECLRTVSPDQAAAFTAAYGNGGSTNRIPQGTASQLSQLQGGNENLRPEEAHTYSLGVTITPEGVPGFNGSIDYWDIQLDDEVGTFPASVLLNGCPDTGDPVFCSQLVRNPETFSLDGASVLTGGYIVQTNQNIASSEVSGVDLQAVYQLDFQRRGSLNLALAGSYMLKNETTPYPGAHTYDCTGLFGVTCQTVNPTWRHILRATWNTSKGVSATLSWRYIGEVKQDNNDSDPTLQNSAFAGFDPFNAKIGAQNYLDLAATYTVRKFQLRAGINNLTDKNPPFVTSDISAGGAPNTYGTYDIFGRQVFLALNWTL